MIVPVVRYAVVCDRCGLNSLTDEFDHYDVTAVGFRSDARANVEYLRWTSVGERDLCPTCTDETCEEGHDYVRGGGEWWVLPGPVGVRYRDCRNHGCQVTEFSDGSSHRRLPDHEVTLVTYTAGDEVLMVRPNTAPE